MKIYIAECYDRHIDPVIRVFDTPGAAVAYAKEFAHENAAHKDGIREQKMSWAIFYCQFSVEGDHTLVKEGLLNDAN